MRTNAFSQLLGREQAIRFNHRLLRMHPLRLDGVEPGALGGQEERQDTNAFARLFDLLVVLANPVPNQFAHVPGGIIPDQEPVAFALGSQAFTTQRQKLNADRTYWAPGDEAQPDLRTVGIVGRSLLPQDAIAGQGLGVGVALFPGLLDQANRMLFTLPGMHARSSKAAPPHFIKKTDGPFRLLAGVGDQAVACVFFSRYCGSGLVIQCLARFQFVPKRPRARRTLSPETRVGVSPCLKLTWAASGSPTGALWLGLVRRDRMPTESGIGARQRLLMSAIPPGPGCARLRSK